MQSKGLPGQTNLLTSHHITPLHMENTALAVKPTPWRKAAATAEGRGSFVREGALGGPGGEGEGDGVRPVSEFG